MCLWPSQNRVMPAKAGMTGEGAGGGKRPVGVRRAAFRDLMRVLQIVGKPAWATPVLIGVGLASSFAETIGITLILLFLYAVTGHTANTGGLLGMAVGRPRISLAAPASWPG